MLQFFRFLVFFLFKMFITKEFAISTAKSFDIIDITDKVEGFLKSKWLKNWLINVFTRHTSAIIKINEAEDWLWKDLENWSDKVIPIDARYHHNDLPNRDPKTMCASKEECLNWHSHIRSMLLGVSSETIPVVDWKMLLWEWQRILFIEMDHARDRKVIFSFIGD